jgi:stalled ribosome rescue protein Dom34
MTEHNHAVIWIDHHEAKVFRFNAEDVGRLVIKAQDPHAHLHHKANSIGAGHLAEDQKFLHSVVEAIRAAHAVLITGPGLAKTALIKHIASHDPSFMERVAGVETVDHPSDGALVAHARTYFKAADRRTPQKL